MSWVALAAVGGLVGVDATSFPQAMFSRPIIAATLAGLALGKPAHGLVIGAVLEVFALVILPFGATRYPESGTAAAAASAAYSLQATATIDQQLLLTAVVFALVWEHVAGASVVFIRRVNERMVANLGGSPNAAQEVPRRQLLAIGIDALRGALVVLLGTAAATLLLRSFQPSLAVSPEFSGRVLLVASMVMLGSILPLFGGIKERRYSYSAGLLCGLLFLFL